MEVTVENPIAVTTHANPAPVVRPATITLILQLLSLAGALVNSIRSKATADAREAKAAGAHVVLPIAGASLALIDVLAPPPLLLPQWKKQRQQQLPQLLLYYKTLLIQQFKLS